jgi:eukaryotic-like serine/threonine-protein kinase
MPLAPGTTLGPYEIQSAIGAGGMGEVYRARDTRLDRIVAVKVLPSHLTANEALRQRLEREARAISKLSHPNICTLHDIGRHEGIDFLVMEYLEGENLEQRLKKGPLPVDQTSRYAAQIADALAHAHKLGITHRDLKPSNVMLTKSGTKLMDFGLAKQSELASLSAALTQMTAEQSKLTGEGMLVGTFQYMAPEQLEGKEADPRTDLFAFGEVMYEMATGKPAFSGGSRASLIASILTTEPAAITQVQPLTPPALERIVCRCLAKDPDDRWQSAADLASELKWMSTGSGTTQVGVPARPAVQPKVDWKLWSMIAMALLAIGAILFHYISRPASPPSARMRWIISPPEGTSFLATGDAPAPVSMSPDGRRIAFVAGESGKVQLYIQSLDTLKATALTGTEGASWPFWSPDSRSVGFFAHGQLERVDADGGTPIDLCEARVPRGGSWGTGGIIVFAPETTSSLYRISASGGQPVSITTIDPAQHDSHRWPFFLPDGKHFLFYAAGHDDISHSHDGLYISSVDGGASKFLLHTHANAAYANGHVLFMNDHVLMAQPFDLGRLELSGEPAVVQDGVEEHRTWWMSVFSASQNGMLVFAPAVQPDNQLQWMDLNGKKLGTVGESGRYVSVRLSPDGGQLAVERDRPHHDIWLHDLRRNFGNQFTPGATAGLPVWSNDGSKIAFSYEKPGGLDLHVKSVTGAQDEEVLLTPNGYAFPLDWSADGSVLLYYTDDGTELHAELRVMTMRGPRSTRLLLKAPLYTSNGVFSPDMRWIAYSTRESGTQRVFATPYPGPGPRIPISPGYGGNPVWQKDGHAVLYLGDNSSIRVTEVSEHGSDLVVGKTRDMSQVIEAPVGEGFPFDVGEDGRILLISRGNDNRIQLVVVSNWDAALRK